MTWTDRMAADYYPDDRDVRSRVASRLVNEVRGIDRVTGKPPGTIEGE